MYPADVKTEQLKPPRRRRGLGCIIRVLSVLVILLVIAAAGWVFALRPYLHNIAETELDKAMTVAVQQIPDQATLLPTGSVLPVTENSITNLIAGNLAPSNPVKAPQAHITPSNIRIDFQIYGYACAITAIPQVVNGKLTASNVGVQGVIGLIMSPDDIAGLLNKHLADAQTRLGHNITIVKLDNQVMHLTIG